VQCGGQGFDPLCSTSNVHCFNDLPVLTFVSV